jgi:hypothetical protein
MADDFDKFTDDEDVDEDLNDDLDEDIDELSDEVKEGLPSVRIKMFPTGTRGSAFREKNDPLSPWQRRNVMQRKGAFNIQCTCMDIIHGKMGLASNALATLVVLKFRFDKRRLRRRIASADLSVEFCGMHAEGARPAVHAIAPHDRYAIVETTLHREDSSEGNINLNINAFQAMNGGGSYTVRKTTSEDLNDATTVCGSIDLVGYPYGDPNCASWTLLENETRKTGVPSSLQVAVLLKRKSKEQFKCMVEVKARADLKTRLEWLLGTPPEDDAVLFDPEIKPTNNLRTYDTDKLGELKLESLWEVGLVGAKKTDVSKPE